MAETSTTIPVYPYWDQVPAEELKTKTQLSKAGLKPGGPVRARVRYTVRRELREYELYAVSEAKPKKEMSPAQKAALEKAQLVQRTCKFCGAIVERPSLLSPKGRCPDCLVALRRRKRAKEVDATILWARGLLQRDDVLILDTETTDLDGYLVEVGIIALDGSIVFDSLVNPEATIEATHIHGITREMVWDKPTFADLEPQLRRLLHGKTVVTYNAAFDSGVFEREVRRLSTPPDEALDLLIERRWLTWNGRDREWHLSPIGNGDWRIFHDGRDAYTGWPLGLAYEQAKWWIGQSTWECAMEEYAVFFGEWSDYYGSYKYLPLGGGHRAVGDARACLDVVRFLASAKLSTETEADQPIATAPFS